MFIRGVIKIIKSATSGQTKFLGGEVFFWLGAHESQSLKCFLVASETMLKPLCLSPTKKMGLKRHFLNKILNTKVFLILIKYAKTI